MAEVLGLAITDYDNRAGRASQPQAA